MPGVEDWINGPMPIIQRLFGKLTYSFPFSKSCIKVPNTLTLCLSVKEPLHGCQRFAPVHYFDADQTQSDIVDARKDVFTCYWCVSDGKTEGHYTRVKEFFTKKLEEKNAMTWVMCICTESCYRPIVAPTSIISPSCALFSGWQQDSFHGIK